MPMTHEGLSQAEVVEILAACPGVRPRDLSLTEFHSQLAESLAETSSRLAKRVLSFGKDQIQLLAQLIDMVRGLAVPDPAPSGSPSPESEDTQPRGNMEATVLVKPVGQLPPSTPESRPSRLKPKPGTRSSCRPLSPVVGADIPSQLTDISTGGVGLIVAEPLCEGQAVSVNLQGPGDSRPVRRVGTVRWWAPQLDGRFRVGIQFQERLRQSDLAGIV